MKQNLLTILLLFVAISTLFSQSKTSKTDTKPLMGFFGDNAVKQREWESKFDSYLSPDSLRNWMKILSARPHHVGSPYDSMNAEFIAAKYKSWGFDAKIEKFYVLFPTPKTRILEMVEPEKFNATLTEPILKEDSTSNQIKEQVPTYNAYSIDGDVTGELVYVNYGVPKDYEELAKAGISVKGKIALARYGGSWRGIKPKVAGENGAIGCIIYSDPKNDGYYQGDVYPKGAYRSSDGAQRGSVKDMPIYPGDPLTPFAPATKDAKRLSMTDDNTLTKIPVLPISYGDALPLLQNLGGQIVPDEWRGALPLPYHFGPGPAKVHLKLEFNWDIVPIYNVIATVKGSSLPDEWIIRGNHHDAWVNGANDPLSGQVATLAEGFAIGKLLKQGWKPKRTIVYCAWDGEEPALLGSTEWVEMHKQELQSKTVAYINSDATGRGFLYMGGSHSLENFMSEVAKDVIDPETKVSVFERSKALDIANSSGDDRNTARGRTAIRLDPLGSGSDFTPFLQFAGIATIDLGYGGENGGGSYHSIYDSYSHYTRFGDPTFEYGVSLSKTGGRTILRLANADMLPFDFAASADVISTYAKEVVDLLAQERKETEENNQLLADKTLQLVADPKETFVPPSMKDAVPFINFSPLQNAVSLLQERTKDFNTAKDLVNSTGTMNENLINSLNKIFAMSEQTLTDTTGLPGRPWYRHEIYAPGKYTGYGVKTLPGIREAIEQRNWKEAESQVTVAARTIERFAEQIQKATNIMKEMGKK